MGFLGLWVVWSLLGGPGEKKRENQMYLQHVRIFAPFQAQNFNKNQFKKFRYFLQFLQIFRQIIIFQPDFHENLPEFREIS